MPYYARVIITHIRIITTIYTIYYILYIYDIYSVLVGNKCDLEDQRQVQQAEGTELAKEWGDNSQFFETSAKEKINHEECFYAAVRLVRSQVKKNQQESGNSSGGGGIKFCEIL